MVTLPHTKPRLQRSASCRNPKGFLFFTGEKEYGVRWNGRGSQKNLEKKELEQ